MWLYIYSSFFWLLGGFVSGITSFGGNLFAVPIVALAMPPRDAILMGCISGAGVFLGMSMVYRRGIAWRAALLLAAGALGGIPLGTWFLAHAGERALLLGASFCLALFLLWQFALNRMRAAPRPVAFFWGLPLGVASGVMMSAMGMGGPALVAYAYLRRLEKEATLGTVNAASSLIMLAVLPWQYAGGLYTPETISLGLAGALAACLGIAASVPVAQKINNAIFRKALLAMLGLSCLLLLFRGVFTG